MPELPDVEVLKEYVDSTSLHRTISGASVREQLVEGTAPQTIRDRLRGSELSETRRHGKHLFVHSSNGGWLRLHFGMTGTLDASGAGDPPEHTELRIDFEDGGRLAYVNQRKFGHVAWEDDPDRFVDQERLGPDALDGLSDREQFRDLLGSRRGTIKSALMNQSVIAGLGNIYVDEILFHAEIHPDSDLASLSRNHLDVVYDTMRRILSEAIDRGADADRIPESWLLPNREPGTSCPRCGGELQKTEVAGRATYVCPGHQRLIG